MARPAVELIRTLKERYPAHAETLEAIAAVAEVVDSLPIEVFFDPVSVVEIHRGERQLLTVDAPHVAAWAKHVAYATRVRMRALEISILREICDAHLTASAALLRAHLETAGLASHAYLTLMDSVTSGNTQRLDELMRATLFGTALFKETKKVPELEDYLTVTAQSTARACEYLKGLDRFLEPSKQPGTRQRLRYALLCDWAHPNPGGFKGFSRVVHATEEGWVVQYSWQEELGTYGLQMVVEYLLENMRLGYAASEFLRLIRIADENGRLRCNLPDPADIAQITKKIMRLA